MNTALSVTQRLSNPTETEPNPDWKRQLVECLDAYRAKHSETASPFPAIPQTAINSKASRIARTVAERYASVPTYSELLAQAKAKQEAEAARAKQAELNFSAEPEPAMQGAVTEAAVTESAALAEEQIGRANVEGTVGEPACAGAAVSQLGTPVLPQFAARTQEMHLHQSAPEPEPSLEDLWASALVEPRSLLPSKLIEFPRELVSSHRSRSRAIQDAAAPQPEISQLRIFEVQPETAEQPIAATQNANETNLTPSRKADSTGEATDTKPAASITLAVDSLPNRETPPVQPSPVTTGAATTPHSRAVSVSRSSSSGVASSARAYKNLEWAAISLDKEPALARNKVPASVADYIPFLVDPASIDQRVMAFAVDFAAVTAGFFAFLLVFAASTPHLPTGLTAVALGGVVYVSLWILYQTLFFSLSGSTAGMLYAHIALCTFDDQNPTRSALRRRLAAWWLSCLPLGLGFLWCFVDEDNLCWHDRITQMYQRTY